jgi:hypothetical protein
MAKPIPAVEPVTMAVLAERSIFIAVPFIRAYARESTLETS